MQWRPIESAPKDGTKVILLIDDVAISGWWSNLPDCGYERDGWEVANLPCHGCGCCSSSNAMPTGWMPFPDPPTDEFITVPRMEME